MNSVIFSIDNATNTHALAKFLRHWDTQEAMQKTKGRLIPMVGKWRGALEYSFLCLEEDFKNHIEAFGYTKGQEAIWKVGSDKRMPVENYYDGSFVGYLQEVSPESAFKAEGFSYRPDLDTYWVLK